MCHCKQDSDHCLNSQASSEANATAEQAEAAIGHASTEQSCWYALRDLKRPNAKVMAWQALSDAGFTVFTPLRWVATATPGGKRVRRQVPAVPDLLFVRATRSQLDPHIARTATLQYRYARGGAAGTPITVPTAEMDRFIAAATAAPSTRYYLPTELTPAMLGRSVRIVGGPLEGYTGTLLALRGTRTRRLLISLAGLLTAAVEVAPQFIQLT